jgi:hypothetical protein
MQTAHITYPYKLPRWISGMFMVLIPLTMMGMYYQATTKGFQTRSGQPVNPAVIWSIVSILVLGLLGAIRIFHLSFSKQLLLSLDDRGLTMPKHPFTSTLIHVPYHKIDSVAPLVLKPDILVIKHHTFGASTLTIQCQGLPNREAFERVQSELILRAGANRR